LELKMVRNDDLVRFSVSLPRGLLAKLDERVLSRGDTTRSELVRDMIREQILESQWSEGTEDMVGVLTITYNHHQRMLTNRLMHLQHHRYINVLCTTHVHLDHETCLEAIILKGRPREIERLGEEIAGLKGVKLARLTRATKIEL